MAIGPHHLNIRLFVRDYKDCIGYSVLTRVATQCNLQSVLRTYDEFSGVNGVIHK